MRAAETLAIIDKAMTADQGASFRTHLKELMPQADDAYRGAEPEFRNHLGASVLGRDCAREVWYSFHWATSKKFDGRMLRLFNRGHLEEPRMVAMLKMIGVRVEQYDARGKQFRISKGYKGHGGGGMDGVLFGVPDMPSTWMLGEFKTHGEKSYIKLMEDGLLKAKWEHYVQCQMYMGDQGLSHALYMAVNKNTDDLHGEIIKFDRPTFERQTMRLKLIIDATEAPPKIGKDETFFKCKFCDHREVCHKRAPPAMNCRTCQYSTVLEGGKWGCNKHLEFRTFDEQLVGCPQYVIMPGLYA